MTNEIELASPEELFPDLECVKIAKGQIKVESVIEARKILHAVEPEKLFVKDVEKVNTPFRKELMLKKTRELVALTVNADPKDDQLHLMLDMFDYLALDWVYSDALHWNGSLADSYAKKIKEYLTPKTEA